MKSLAPHTQMPKPSEPPAPSSSINPPTPSDATPVAAMRAPSSDALMQANAALLTQNATLLRQNNDLGTQVNVLVHERSAQFFVYGAMTAAVCFALGLLLGFWIKRRSGF